MRNRPVNNQGVARVSFILLFAFFLTTYGCGGGGGSDSGAPNGNAPPTFTLSGTITPPPGLEIDSDVNDPNETYAPNDTIGTAQEIANPISLGGYVNVAGTGPAGPSQAPGDRDDYFSVNLNAGDRIFLAIGDYNAGDLDLWIYDPAIGSFIDASIGVTEFESLKSPGSGTYIVNVYAYSGASNYVLTIGTDFSGRALAALSSQQDFAPGQAIVRFVDLPQAAPSKGLAERTAALGLHLAAGAPGREALLTFTGGDLQQGALQAMGIDANQTLRRTANTDLQAKLDTLSVIKALRKRRDVLSAEPNYILRHYATPNDTYYHLQWHYPLIHLPQAWDETTGSSDVVVAVVDTGVLINHPDLAGKLTADGYDFISDIGRANDGDGIDVNADDPGDGATPGASSFHGTHCAGTIAAATNNAIGLAGVSWGSKIMPIRVLGKGGGTMYDIMQGVRYAARMTNDSGTLPSRAADIVSMSLGGSGFSAATQDLFTNVRNAGIILIAAAGNESASTPSYPASYDGVISVSAVNINSSLTSYSNYGAYIDMAAPGGDWGDLDGDGYQDQVWSTCGDDSTGTILYNYKLLAGTSMATPHVAGVVALMKAVSPGLTPADLDAYLQTGRITTDIGAAGRDDYYGYGLIDANKAVLAAKGDPPGTILRIDPPALNFGTTATSSVLTVSKIGSDTLEVTAAETASWLSIAAESVDAAGLGTYTVQVNRTGLVDGTYSASITFTPSTGSPVAVPVNLQVNSTTGSADAGFHYVLLVNSSTYDPVQQDNAAAANGTYSYSFTSVPLGGSYLIFAGSDRDNDGFIDNTGESFGVYSSLDQITTVEVDGNRTDLNFATDLKVSLPEATSASIRKGGYIGKLPELKRLR